MFTYTHKFSAREKRLIFQIGENPDDDKEKVQNLDDLDSEELEALAKRNKDAKVGLAETARGKDVDRLNQLEQTQKELMGQVGDGTESTEDPDGAGEKLAEGAAADFESMMSGNMEADIHEKAEVKNPEKEQKEQVDVQESNEQTVAEGAETSGSNEAATPSTQLKQ